jgi:hypothetical protein
MTALTATQEMTLYLVMLVTISSPDLLETITWLAMREMMTSTVVQVVTSFGEIVGCIQYTIIAQPKAIKSCLNLIVK